MLDYVFKTYLHLLDLNGVRFATTHVQFMVAHAEGENALVDAQTRCNEDKVTRLLVNGLDHKALIIEGNVANLAPGKANLGRELVVLLVNVKAEGVHTEPQFSALLVLNLKVVDAVHLQVLGDLEVLHHGLLSGHALVLVPPVGDAFLPLLTG